MSFSEIIVKNIEKKIKATGIKKKFVLPESKDLRTLKALSELSKKNWIEKIFTIGNLKDIEAESCKNNLDLSKVSVIDIENFNKMDEFINEFMELRKKKGISKEDAEKTMKNPLYFAAMMLRMNMVDGMVAGAVNSTANVLRAAIQTVKTKPGSKIISSSFIMSVPDCELSSNGLFLFADCAVNPNPDTEQLAEIAISTAETAHILCDIEPIVAMLSFSTKGSAKHEFVDKVANSIDIIRSKKPGLKVDGELQLDAAIVEKVASQKAPESTVAGKANVLVFPDLQSGNIGYKLVQRLAKAEALGPIIQGLNKPVNDLSRGCSVEDIIKVSAITALQSYL